MKLIKCHIENFGKLQDYSVDFEKGFNLFCHENGWGKSTLVAFIRIMFFGFEGERKRDTNNERNFYHPWQDGTYGGQIVFERNGKQYRMFRKFGKKESDDIFELRDAVTNLESHDYSSDIGREIFAIDSESFKRTIYVGQNDCMTNTTGDINAKMGNLTDNTNDLTNYDAANQRLKDILNQMAPDKKRGSIKQLKNEATDLETQIKKEDAINKALQDLQGKIEEKNAELKVLKEEQIEISNQQKKASTYKDFQAKKERYEDIVKSYDDAKRAFDEVQNVFPERIPSKEELEEALAQCTDMMSERTLLERTKMSEKEETSLQSLKMRFQNGVRSEDDFAQIRRKNQRLLHLRNELAQASLTEEENQKLRQYEETFGEEEDVTKRLSELQMHWTDRTNKKNMLSMKQAEIARLKTVEEANKTQNTNKKVSPMLLIGVLLAIIGGIACIKILIPGIVLLVLGAILIIAGVLMGKDQPEGQQIQDNSHIAVLENEIKSDEEFIKRTEQEVSTYMNARGIAYDVNMVQFHLQNLSQDAIRYEDLRKKASKVQGNESVRECEALMQNVKDFLLQYDIVCEEQQYADAINQLENDQKDYLNLTDKEYSNAEHLDRWKQKKNELEHLLQEIGYEPEDDIRGQIIGLQNQLRLYESAKKTYETERQKKEDFEQSNDVKILLNLSSEEVSDLTDLNTAYEQKNDAIEEVKRVISEYKNQLEGRSQESDEINEAKEKLSVINEEIASETKKYELLKKTQELLTQAKESLTARYIGPLKESFSKYYELLVGNTAEDYHIDANAKVTVEEQGMQRQTFSYSTGYQDLIGLCLRLAFIDAMYEDEKSLIIMDDPFVNLDQKKIEGGKRLLEEVAKEYQIIYMTCNEGRA